MKYIKSFESIATDNYYLKINDIGNFAELMKVGNKRSLAHAFLNFEDISVLDTQTGGQKTLEFDDKNIYIPVIKVENRYVGKGIGRIFLKLLFEKLGNDKFTFYSINHPYWGRIAHRLPYTTFSGKGQYYFITKEMYE